MLVGLYGGTFDPIHNGHIHAAQAVRGALGLASMRLILSARPGHRHAPNADIDHRWQMLSRACDEIDGLQADDREIKRQGHSYTIDTLVEYINQHPGHIPCWILGQDSFATLPSWHRWQDLLTYCNLVVLDRPGLRLPESDALVALCADVQIADVECLDHQATGQILRLPLTMQEVSATQIRQRVAQGLSVDHLLVQSVRQYINEQNLYRAH